MLPPVRWRLMHFLPNITLNAVSFFLALELLIPAIACAYRPFDSTDASVANVGESELEFGPVGYVRTGDEHFLVAPSVVANLGVARNWELVAQGRLFNGLDLPPGEAHTRLVDTGAFLKGVLREGSLQGETGPSVATEFGALLPSIHDRPGTGATAIAIVSERTPSATMHFNLAGSYTPAGNPDLFFGAILEGPYEWPIRPVGEFFFEREFGESMTNSGLIGAIWRYRDELSFDSGLRAARAEGKSVFEVRVGLTCAIRVW
jgi:hypothetical protein